MNVHEAISRHSTKQHVHLQQFTDLDQKREELIEEAVQACLAGQPFSVEKINQVTETIIQHAKHGISPLRKKVTEEMVRDFAEKLRQES